MKRGCSFASSIARSSTISHLGQIPLSCLRRLIAPVSCVRLPAASTCSNQQRLLFVPRAFSLRCQVGR